ncbi:ATP-dependent acyl-CoA ligase [Paenarthrobacter ureafaciens]|uniref:ATP-dependent acyl-CoA ligase n=1 Tax=Paenarthrobacter TaxID=1742992 RepID=UPI00140D6CE9|nr:MULTISPECIES: ATP-dependent acyl-CoA ligase [Paenarthrobacter]MCX8453538.1 ATP-dependent acyl-CoA ligase [Paenarthrobacter ureafaciens]MCY0973197.1 ATP-dependent acyl-CoA ligase [Paenarthrobacter ureafaciens]MDP9933863.1 crotonobetaine/carnitine-CoA ligase [Paenarthrobacter nicotinovorans]NWL27193.1 ATP-dependent acyl-CoA ligase [Paenarthrobacter ureafaciens]
MFDDTYHAGSGPASMTVPGLLINRAIKRPNAPLLRCGSIRRDGQQMLQAIALAGGVLVNHGIRPGDRVALMSSNRVELLDLILGCAWVGAIAVPINTAARGEQLHHILANSESSLLVTEGALLEHVDRIPELSSLRQIWLLDEPDSGLGSRYPVTGLPQPDSRAEPAPVLPGDTAAILYTSGTTGVSKGVQCPQGQFYWWGVNVSQQLELTDKDVLYTCLPLFHTNALNAFSQALVSGAEYVLGPRFSASRFWSDVHSAGATFTYLLGAMVSILASKPPTPLDRAHGVVAALAPATPAGLLESFRDRFGITLMDGYGSTETNSIVASSRREQRPGYMGKVQPGFSARVVDEYGLEVPAGQPGELLLRSDQPHAFATGYYRMPEATVTAWKDLWFHTGDRVVVDADGWMRFVDRIKDVIRRRGENISSAEVEHALLEHPLISEAAVYAVDSELGEDEVMAAIVVKEPIEFSEIAAFCEPLLAKYAIPRFMRIVQDLPKTENGKVRKTVLREEGTAAAQWDRESQQHKQSTPALSPMGHR